MAEASAAEAHSVAAVAAAHNAVAEAHIVAAVAAAHHNTVAAAHNAAVAVAVAAAAAANIVSAAAVEVAGLSAESQEAAVTSQAAIAEGIAAAAVAPLWLALAAVAAEHALAKEAAAMARVEASTRHIAVVMAPVEEVAVVDISQLPPMEAVAPPPDAAWSAGGLCARRVTTSALALTPPGCRARRQNPARRAAEICQHMGRARRCGASSPRRGQRHHPRGGAGPDWP